MEQSRELTADARVHELLVLLAQPEVEVPETPMEPVEDPAVQVTLEAPVSLGRTTLNFLQEDELAIPDTVETDFVVVEPASVPGSIPVSLHPTPNLPPFSSTLPRLRHDQGSS